VWRGIIFPEKLARAAYATAKAMAMREVPLVTADGPDQWEYLRSSPATLGAAVVYASDLDATTQALDNVSRQGYLFLVLDEDLTGTLADLVRYYLIKRDELDDSDPLLERRFGSDCIHNDHRLVLVCNRAMSHRVPRWFRERLTIIAVRR
jgi:hypothetical protein